MRSLFSLLCLITLFAPPAWAQLGSGLPDWAKTALAEKEGVAPPEKADLWRLLDETIISPDNKGRITVQRRVVQKVITEHGVDLASIFVIDGDPNTTKVKRLKGWHQNSRGKITKLDKANVFTVSQAQINRVSHDASTAAYFEKVGRNSIIVFESKERRTEVFNQDLVFMLSNFPIAKRVIDVRLTGAQLQPVNFDSWQLTYQQEGTRLVAKHLPEIQREWMTADSGYFFPYLIINHRQGTEFDVTFDTWSSLGSWYYRTFAQSASFQEGGEAIDNITQLAGIFERQQKDISYRQRYLTPGRGWVPASGGDVQRRKYGDCKDMVACLGFEATKQKIAVYPALATIIRDYYPDETKPVSPFAFNHVIAAVPLKQSLGLAAEVMVDNQLMLLVDPTSKGTPLGYLPADYRGRQVFLCNKEGGAWIEIPEKALEKRAIKVQVFGRLDQHHTLGGSLIISSRGNALGLRMLPDNRDPEDVEWLVRRGLDIPGTAVLTINHVAPGEPGEIQVTCQVMWPSFLRHDVHGFRLPGTIVPHTRLQIEDRGKERQQAIRIAPQVATSWVMSLSTVRPMAPGAEATEWSDDTRRFAWKASGGKTLKVEYHRAGKKRLFPKSDLQAGIDYWEGYRENYNAFYLTDTLFQEVPSAN
ncbi:hypothetical protein [Acanthopleuribacter pedis]|uniref:DUF3857 domain-containing protein n=1 Tax=Acanthopleuribacter pedis TaxID=442870 RepID=A0A8J7U2S2_9BACT|nr:hypothetical protein [Acanthopleuribacter pedis]MBO1318872.1 hypothetical protein [Acanthopleuribacter pedis]